MLLSTQQHWALRVDSTKDAPAQHDDLLHAPCAGLFMELSVNACITL